MTDFVCGICNQLGDLLICDGPCGRCFHLSCLNLDEVPEGDDWKCSMCLSEKLICFKCKEMGNMDEFIKCTAQNCSKSYHKKCVTVPEKNKFRCSQHACSACSLSGKGSLLVCVLCPKAAHKKCINVGHEETFDDENDDVPCYICYEHAAEIEAYRKKKQLTFLQNSIFAKAADRSYLTPPNHPFFVKSIEQLPAPEDFKIPYKLYQQGKGEGSKPTPFQKITKNIYLPGMRPKIIKDEIMVCRCNPAKSPCEQDTCENAQIFIECMPSTCPCKAACKNQRFQRRSYPSLKLFKTDGKGFGMKANENIPAGSLVQEYMGEVLPHEAYVDRLKSYKEDTPVYFFNLDANFTIDASAYGSMARFINHSCNPNCHTEKWSVGAETRIGIVATDDIPKGTEVTYNYQFESFGDHKHKCFCGASNCSGFIGQRPKKTEEDDKPKKGKKRNKSAHEKENAKKNRN